MREGYYSKVAEQIETLDTVSEQMIENVKEMRKCISNLYSMGVISCLKDNERLQQENERLQQENGRIKGELVDEIDKAFKRIERTERNYYALKESSSGDNDDN